MSIRHAAGPYLALTVLVSSCIAAVAQAPTSEQQAAIRGSCRSDFMSRCSGVQPGGPEALACLRNNVAQLSPACQTAVNAATPKPAAASPAAASAPPPPAPAARAAAPPLPAAPAAAPAPAAGSAPPPAPAGVPSADQVAAIRASCPSDFAAHCAGVQPGGMEGLTCLQRNAARLSAPCRFAVVGSGAPAPAAAAPTAAPPAAAAAPAQPAAPARTAAKPPAAPAPAPAAAKPAAAAAPTPPTADQQAAIRNSCRNDFMAKCSGVQPGGPEAFQCLKRNEAQLSVPCKTAVSAIGAIGAPAAAAAAPAAAAPAAPTAAQQNAIKASCRSDFMANCRGVQPGGPEAFQCLQRNAARLSPDCKTAIAAVTDPAASAAAASAPAAAPPAAHAGPGLFPVRRAIREKMMGN